MVCEACGMRSPRANSWRKSEIEWNKMVRALKHHDALAAALVEIRGRVYGANGEVLGFDGITGVERPGVEAARVAHAALTAMNAIEEAK